MAPSMRWKASKRPPASHTAMFILAPIWFAFSTAPAITRLASARVRVMGSSKNGNATWAAANAPARQSSYKVTLLSSRRVKSQPFVAQSASLLQPDVAQRFVGSLVDLEDVAV